MAQWIDVTDTFDEDTRFWKGLYMEQCEVIDDIVECSLFSSKTDDWEIYFNYGIMHGVIYAPEDKAWDTRKEIKKEILEEYEKSGSQPSDEFMAAFGKKYDIDVMNAFFKWDLTDFF